MPTDRFTDKTSLASLSLNRSYRSSDDPLKSFYVPCLSRAIQYDRAAGFFDSRSLSIGARGVAGLIKNGGKMRLLTSPRFSNKDLEVISDVVTDSRESVQSDDKLFTEALDSALHRGLEAEKFEQYLRQDRFRCLAWMLKEELLEIRVAIMPDHPGMSPYRIYHEKIGLIEDKYNNEIAFTGSINETAAGWTENYESFDVYRSWCDEQDRISDKQDAFVRLWENRDNRVEVRKLPDSVESIIVEQSPETMDGLPALDIFFTEEGAAETGSDNSLDLWDHQQEAIDWWKSHEYKGVFAMATGTGKTLTALRAARLEADVRLTIVVVPTQILIEQWHDEIQDVFGKETLLLECTGGTGWRDEILQIVDIYREGSLESVTDISRTVLLTTPHTASSGAFQQALRHIDSSRLQMIIDEVHNVGAPTFQQVLDIDAGRRIGLSATPDRKWDEEGTNAIYNYFGGHDPFRFETQEAIDNEYLSPYEYHPIICHFTPEEYDEFNQLTMKIKRQSAMTNSTHDSDSRDHLERLLQQRARIKKGATQKPARFGDFLDMDHPTPAIVFCEDTEQLEDIRTQLDDRNLRYGVYISSRESEQGVAFHKFETGAIDYLLAIRCLDEGVDVPDCPTAVLISSSTNKRQFIQRRGRVLRTSSEKEQAVIYDMLVFPSVQAAAGEDAAMTLIKQELDRAKLLMKAAMNRKTSERQLAKELDSYDKDISYLAYI